jgi:hypothetical protein
MRGLVRVGVCAEHERPGSEAVPGLALPVSGTIAGADRTGSESCIPAAFGLLLLRRGWNEAERGGADDDDDSGGILSPARGGMPHAGAPDIRLE